MTKQDRQTVAILRGIVTALDSIECRGLHNHGMLTACGNELNALINKLENGGEDNAVVHTEPET